MNKQNEKLPVATPHPLSKYYQFQSKIYDLTRWSFLFGRRQLIQKLPFRPENRFRVLEVGCGTGKNLAALGRRFPYAEITGLDLSEEMLERCRKKIRPFKGRVNTIHGAFGDIPLKEDFDLIIFSYCLTMVNPGWQRLIRLAADSLRPNGIIAVVDFHDTTRPAFAKHMGTHHVRMDGHLLPELQDIYQEKDSKVNRAYLGVWHWFYFIGRRRKQY